MRYQHYIWDFDGTLFDSYPHSCAIFWDVLGEEGLQAGRTPDELLAHMLVTFGDAVQWSGISPEGYARFFERTHRVGDEELLPKVRPFADCETVLRAVVAAGGKNYLYTHRNYTARWYLDTYGMSRYFTDMLMEEEGFPAKPAPDALLALLARNHLEPDGCIMVGDREIDGLAGENAGMTGALVHYPPCLPDGSCPADRTVLTVTAENLTEFARKMGIL